MGRAEVPNRDLPIVNYASNRNGRTLMSRDLEVEKDEEV